VDLWETYGPLFHFEETVVFPPEDAEMSFYRALRSRCPGTCLELGAGAGRLAEALLSDAPTLALEASRIMLGLWPAALVPLALRVRGLAQEIPLREGSVDLVLLTYNFLHCLTDPADRRDLLSESARVLRRGGSLVLEACPAFSSRRCETGAERYVHDGDGVSLRLVESVTVDREEGIITFGMCYEGSAATPPPGRLDLRLALLSAGEILHRLVEAGFLVRSVWGDYDLSPWCGGCSPRLLVLAERK